MPYQKNPGSSWWFLQGCFHLLPCAWKWEEQSPPLSRTGKIPKESLSVSRPVGMVDMVREGPLNDTTFLELSTSISPGQSNSQMDPCHLFKAVLEATGWRIAGSAREVPGVGSKDTRQRHFNWLHKMMGFLVTFSYKCIMYLDHIHPHYPSFYSPPSSQILHLLLLCVSVCLSFLSFFLLDRVSLCSCLWLA